MVDNVHLVIHVPRPSRLRAYMHSRRRPPDIEFNTATAILHNYGLELTGPLRNLPVGRRNRNLDVNTSAGRKLLKGYRPQWNSDTVRYTHSIVNRFAELGSAVPGLVKTCTGDDYVNFESDHYALYDFVNGANYSGGYLLRGHRHKLMAAAGRTLAHFHHTLMGFMPAGRHHMGFRDYDGERWRDINWHTAKLAELVQHSQHLTGAEAQRCGDCLSRNSSFILDELGMLDDVLSQTLLPRLIIHGDYGLHNLLFQRDGNVIVLDFELARLEWRVSDLVSCLSRYRFEGSGQVRYDFESMQSFMNGYQDVYPLSADEWQLLPQVWRFYKVQSAVQYWNSYFQTDGPERKLNSALDALAQVDWARTYPHKLTGLSAASVPSLTVAPAAAKRTFDFGGLN